MTDQGADLTAAEHAEWQAMLEECQRSIQAAGRHHGLVSAASAMVIVALETLRMQVGSDMLAMLLDGLAGKVREGESLTPEAVGEGRPH